MTEIVKSVYNFLKDPLTEKLVKRHVPSKKVREGLDTVVRIVEVLVITMPLIEAAKAGVEELVGHKKSKRAASGSSSRRSSKRISKSSAA